MADTSIGVGIIGTGRRGYELGCCIIDLYGRTDLVIRALCNRTRSRMEEAHSAFTNRYGKHSVSPSIELHDSYEELIDDPGVDLVMIVTPTYAHAGQAIAAIRSGKNVFLDKPIAPNLEDALGICEAERQYGNEIVMGFTRRFEQKWLDTYELVRSGIIGDVKMLLHRAVVPYHNIFQSYMRRREWSGGALAEKVSHLFDVLNWFTGMPPERLSSFGGRLVYTEQKDAPRRCSMCDRECPYRVGERQEMIRPDMMVDFDDSRISESDLIKMHDICVWLPGADINDHGIINIEYAGGIKTAVFWSLFGPDSDDQETMEIVGESGKILLTRHLGRIDIHHSYGARHEVQDRIPDGFDGSHFGADHRLIEELERYCKTGVSPVTARAGLGAARLVEAAHQSVDSGGEITLMDGIPGQDLLARE